MNRKVVNCPMTEPTSAWRTNRGTSTTREMAASTSTSMTSSRSVACVILS